MRIRATLCVLLSFAALLTAAPVRAQVGQDAQDGCSRAGGDARGCRGAYHLVELGGVLCRESGGGRACTNIDGREINERLVRAAERSWMTR